MSMLKLLVPAVLLLSSVLRVIAADTSCAATAVTYRCPIVDSDGSVKYKKLKDCSLCPGGSIFPDAKDNLCIARELFSNSEHYHYLWNDIGGAILYILIAVFATASGVGGGSIYVPLGVLVLAFPAKTSSSLSQVCIFGSAIGGFYLNAGGIHPNSKITMKVDSTLALAPGDPVVFYTRPLIDYNMVLILAPIQMAGAVVGVLAQKVMPNWLYLLLAAVVLLGVATDTFFTFLSKRKADLSAAAAKTTAAEKTDKAAGNATANAKEANINSEVELSVAPLVITDAKVASDASDVESGSITIQTEQVTADVTEVAILSSTTNAYSAAPIERSEEGIKTCAAFLQDDARQYPKEKLGFLALLWLVLLALTFLVGGKGVNSFIGVTCEKPLFDVLTGLQFLWLLGFCGLAAYKIIDGTQKREAVGYPREPTDIVWTPRSFVYYASRLFFVGIFSGTIGIGGGSIMGPFFLKMGLDPRVSSATTATLVFMTASSLAIMYVVSGDMHWSYFLFFFSICGCGGFVGKFQMDAYVKRTGASSWLVGMLAVIIGLSTLGCVTNLLMKLKEGNWCFDGFKPFCPA